MDPRLRAGDRDREHAIDTLRRHTTEGRLGLSEFSDRIAAVYRARTYGDLAAITADLPNLGRQPINPHRPHSAFLAATVLAVLLLVGVLLTATAGWGQMSGIMGTMTSTMSGGCW